MHMHMHMHMHIHVHVHVHVHVRKGQGKRLCGAQCEKSRFPTPGACITPAVAYPLRDVDRVVDGGPCVGSRRELFEEGHLPHTEDP